MNLFLAFMITSGMVFGHADGTEGVSAIQKYQEIITLKPHVVSQIDNFRHTTWSQRLSNALNHSEGHAPCEDPFEEYIGPLVSNIDFGILKLVQDLGIDQIPLYYSLLANQTENGQYFGTFGEETREIVLANFALENFWGLADDNGGSTIVTSNIQLLGMHGADMKDRDQKLIPTLEQMYDINGTDLTYSDFADEIQRIVIEEFPHEFDNPIFTFNAFASSDGFGGEKIVMGDGIIEYLHFKNLGYDGPEVVLGHEFGHQMQYEAEIDILGGLTLPQETRRLELMADAFSGYFLGHSKGGNIQDHRVIALSMAAFAVGDCSFESDGHHGTPLQRECALTWGVNKAASAGDNISHPDNLQRMFDEELNAIVALDESVCKLSLGSNGPGGLPGDNRSAPVAGNETGTTTVTVTTRTNTTTETKTITTKTNAIA